MSSIVKSEWIFGGEFPVGGELLVGEELPVGDIGALDDEALHRCVQEAGARSRLWFRRFAGLVF